jgi:hypothetical protein
MGEGPGWPQVLSILRSRREPSRDTGPTWRCCAKISLDTLECPSEIMRNFSFPWPNNLALPGLAWAPGLILTPGLVLANLMLPQSALAGHDTSYQKINPAAYKACVIQMSKAKVASEDAATACGRVLHPEELGLCVADLMGASVTSTEALTACRKVRRPVALGLCVEDLRAKLKDAPLTDVLSNCTNSLQPDFYASCVLGLTSEKISTASALGKCIEAGSFPAELDPTFIPNN